MNARPTTSPSTPTPALHALQIVVFAVCFITILIDGFDTQAIAYAGPLVIGLLHGNKTVLGLIFSAGLLGGLIGGLVFGPLGDRIGRRTILLTSLVIIALGSFATAIAQTGPQIAASRFFSGLGLGGAIPGVIALSAEYAALKHRSTVVAIVFSGFPLGAVAGAFLSAAVLPIWGWRALFLIGAVLPVLILGIAALCLPESLQYLARAGKSERLATLLNRLGDTGQLLLQDTDKAHGPRASAINLFTDGQARPTLLIWLVCFLSLLSVYCIVNWLPLLAAEAGLPLQFSVMAIAALNIGGIVGNVVLGRLIDKTNAYWPTGAAYLLGAFFVGLIGVSSSSSFHLLSASFAAGLFGIGAQLSVTSIVARLYPVSIRATGIGWSFGVGRLGGVIGPMAAGILLGSGMTFVALMIALGTLSFVAGLAVLLLDRTCPSSTKTAQTRTTT